MHLIRPKGQWQYVTSVHYVCIRYMESTAAPWRTSERTPSTTRYIYPIRDNARYVTSIHCVCIRYVVSTPAPCPSDRTPSTIHYSYPWQREICYIYPCNARLFGHKHTRQTLSHPCPFLSSPKWGRGIMAREMWICEAPSLVQPSLLAPSLRSDELYRQRSGRTHLWHRR